MASITADCRLWNSIHPDGTIVEILHSKFHHVAPAVVGPAFMDKNNEMVVFLSEIPAPLPVRLVKAI